jgi:hypothetical protein
VNLSPVLNRQHPPAPSLALSPLARSAAAEGAAGASQPSVDLPRRRFTRLSKILGEFARSLPFFLKFPPLSFVTGNTTPVSHRRPVAARRPSPARPPPPAAGRRPSQNQRLRSAALLGQSSLYRSTKAAADSFAKETQHFF